MFGSFNQIFAWALEVIYIWTILPHKAQSRIGQNNPKKATKNFTRIVSKSIKKGGALFQDNSPLDVVERPGDGLVVGIHQLESNRVDPFAEAINVIGLPGGKDPVIFFIDGEADLITVSRELAVSDIKI